ncbi:MAG: hypothetical protein JNK63_03900 [Chthonomonas sp.]|nr:hypothetical protein [Chthonomonas sp.]
MKTLLALIALSTVLVGCSSQAPVTDSDAPKPKDSPISGNEATDVSPKVTEADLHIKIYPNSKIINDRSITVKTPNEENALAVFTTEDAPADVVKFFEEQLPGKKFNEFKGGDTVTNMLAVDNADGSKLAVTIIKKADAPTEITIGYGKVNKK